MCSINLPTLDWIWPNRREVWCAVDATSRLLKRYGPLRLDERGCRRMGTKYLTRTEQFVPLHTLVLLSTLPRMNASSLYSMKKTVGKFQFSWCIGAYPDKTSTPIEKPSSHVNGVLATSTTWLHNRGVSKKR